MFELARFVQREKIAVSLQEVNAYKGHCYGREERAS
jgi:hypothetical protein